MLAIQAQISPISGIGSLYNVTFLTLCIPAKLNIILFINLKHINNTMFKRKVCLGSGCLWVVNKHKRGASWQNAGTLNSHSTPHSTPAACKQTNYNLVRQTVNKKSSSEKEKSNKHSAMNYFFTQSLNPKRC